MSINVGDLVTAYEGCTRYSFTNDQSLCIVTKFECDKMYVKIIAHACIKNVLNDEYDVMSDDFVPITVEEFFTKYPDAYKIENIEDCIANMKNFFKNLHQKLLREKQLRYKNRYILSDEKRKELIKEITVLLKEYDYHPTEKGLNAIIDEWSINKADIIRLFDKHPNYNGKFQIAFDADYDRELNYNAIQKFKKYLNKYLVANEIHMDGYSYSEACSLRNKFAQICDCMKALNDMNLGVAKLDEKSIEYYESEYNRLKTLANRMIDYIRTINYRTFGNYVFEKDVWYNTISKFIDFLDLFDYISEPLATEYFADRINDWYPSVKAVKGQKVSRIVNKVCCLLGIDKYEDYNKEFAKFSDAVNPLSIKRHTVLSCHPIDYLTMSFGNSWASCHTIDKHNKRDMPDAYSGGYSGGTMSYMLDGSSVVFYTVDAKYTGNQLELEPKINRNMFHIGEDKIIQARVYPQSNDDTDGIYTKIRNIVQKVIADCMDKPNLWKLRKGTDECEEVTNTIGVHYRDYLNFDSCNVSYLKLDDSGSVNTTKIKIGHNPICPCCGKTHDSEENIECYDCRS